tara:strand:+ start:14593 stop:15864 length:1272 start_codon:yes stop_codon:yes gene_type:complete
METNEPPIYKFKGNTFLERVVYNMVFAWNIIKYYFDYYMKNYKMEVIYLVSLIVYVILICIFFTKNPFNVITNNNKGIGIFLSMLGGLLLLLMFFFYLKKDETTNNSKNYSALGFLGKIILFFLSIVLILGVVYVLFNLSSYFSNITGIVLMLILVSLFIGGAAIAIKYFKLNEFSPNSKPTLFGLIKKAIFYIPCLLLDFVEYLRYQYNITTKPILIILLLEIILVACYFIIPTIYKIILMHNAEQLLENPINLTNEKNLATFKDVNFVKDKFQYSYAISGWFFIDSAPPETNYNYDNFTSILNIGDKPNILYNMSKNKLKITMKTQGKNLKTLYETKDFHLQKWNNIIINYDGKTIDVFLNNELVSSEEGVIPYNNNTVITSGHYNGLYGGICNVIYFKDSISRGKISWLYNSVKYSNPPI